MASPPSPPPRIPRPRRRRTPRAGRQACAHRVGWQPLFLGGGMRKCMGNPMTDPSGKAELRPTHCPTNDAADAKISRTRSGSSQEPTTADSMSKFLKDSSVRKFSHSSDAVFELSLRFAEPFKISDNFSLKEKLEAECLMFLELTHVCLRGNLTGLSLLINMTEDQIKALHSTDGDHLAATEEYS
ncbi:hypothetical protein BDZ97DRAFT_2070947 [Flammula alnicola]|nr:hypothetical protein BDZ97DRAFT_2070947 [Flammula alnicola]